MGSFKISQSDYIEDQSSARAALRNGDDVEILNESGDRVGILSYPKCDDVLLDMSKKKWEALARMAMGCISDDGIGSRIREQASKMLEKGDGAGACEFLAESFEENFFKLTKGGD